MTARFFDEMNMNGDPCPICNEFDSGRVILVPIPNTESGNNIQAHQVHEDCALSVTNTLMEAFLKKAKDNNADG